MNPIELRQIIHQEIDRLPEQALDQVFQIIQQINPPNLAEKSEEILSNVEDDWSDFIGCVEGGPGDLATNKLIGCVEIEENLSTTYKQVLAEGWAKKYASP